MATIAVPYAKVLLTANGSATGLLTVSSTNNLFENALVFLASSTQGIKVLYIESIINSTQLYVKETFGYIYNRFDSSAFLLADGASLTQPSGDLYNSEIISQLNILDHGTKLGLAGSLNILGAATVSMAGNRANITVTGGGGGGSYPLVNTYADLPITVGSPPIDDIYVVKQSTGIWIINRKEKGLWIRTGNTGALTDWSRLGDWIESFSDSNFAIYDNVDTSKQIRLDVGAISPSTVRLYQTPDKDGILALLSDVKFGVKKAGTLIGTRSAVNFIEGTNVTLTVSDDAIGDKVDVTINAAGGGGGGIAVSGGGSLFSSGTLSFGNANGISFVTSNGSLVGSYTVPSVPAQTVQTQNMVSVLGSTGNISFGNGGGITFGGNNSTITAAAPAQTQQPMYFSASGSSTSANTIQFGNSNGVSFSLSNGSVVGTVRTDWLSTQSNQALSGSNGSFAFQTATFGNLNGLSFYTSNGSMVGSYTVPNVPAQTVQTQNVAVPSAGTQTATSGTVVFANSNGISFGMSGSSQITASYTVPTQTVQTQNMVSVLGSTGNISFANGNGVTFGGNASTVTASVAPQTAQTQNIVVPSAGTQTATSGTVSFVNSNGISFGMSGSNQITASHNGLTTQSNQALSGSNGSFAFQTATFGNLNGLSFYTSNGSMVGSYTVPSVPAQTNQTIGAYAVGNTVGQSSSSTFDARTLSLSGAGIVSVGYSGNNIIISAVAAGAGDGYNILAAGTQTANTTGTVVFSNSNNVSFGMNNSSVITASASYSQSTAPAAISAGTTQATNGTVVFSNSNGISFGMNAGTVTASYTVPNVPAQTVQTQNIVLPSAGTQTATSGTVVFANSNGISFGMSGSSQITASYTVPNVPAQTVQTIGAYAVGNTTGQSSSSTFDARTLSLSGAGIISVGYSGNNIIISATGAGGAGDGYNILAAGTQTANTTGSVVFSNSNGISFGMSNSSIITASYTVPTQTVQSLGLYASGNTTGQSSSSTFDARSLSISGMGGVNVGYSSSQLIVSGVQSQFTAGGNITLTPSGSTVSIIGNNPLAASAGTQSLSSGTVIFSNGNGISFGMSNSSVITASHNGLTSQSNQALSGSNGAFTFQTATFGNLNGLSFYTSNGSLVGSFSNAISAFATGNSTQSSSGVLSTNSLIFNGLGIASVGVSNGSVIISVPSGGGVGDGVNILAAGTQTANTTGTVLFSNANGISFGMNNNSVITASYVPGGGGGAVSRYIPDLPGSTASQTYGAMGITSASAQFYPYYFDGDVNFNVIYLINNFSYATSSVSGQQTISSRYGIYSNNAGTLSLISSNSFSIAVTNSSASATISYPVSTDTTGYAYGTTTGTATAQLQSLFGVNAGGRQIGLHFGGSMSLSGGTFYWIGIHQRLSSSSANIGISAGYIGNVVAPFAAMAPMGQISSARTTNSASRPFPGLGVYTSTGSAGYGGTTLPSSVIVSGIAHTLSNRPLVIFSST